MTDIQASDIKKAVRERYGQIAKDKGQTCGCTPSGCCDGTSTESQHTSSLRVGYSLAEVEAAPTGSDLGLGCGNPQAIAALRLGETVLDLGSGAGFDSFLAARQVGETGRVIGVDMTPEMIAKGREYAAAAGYPNVEFRLGEIEHLPVADESVDIIISNCVINLSPDKSDVFREAFRVLKRGGRLAISDVIATSPLPAAVRNDPASFSGCIAGAITTAERESILDQYGLQDIRIRHRDESRQFIRDWAPGSNVEDYVASAVIEAVKPAP